MSESVDPFAKYSSSLTSDQRDQVRATMDKLGLKRTDALFHIMAALDYYRTLYEEIPAQIQQAGADALSAVHSAARLQGEREFAAATVSLAEEVVSAARKMKASRDREIIWMLCVLSVVTTLVVMIGAYLLGRSNGNDRYRASTAEAVAWYQSPDGQYAKFLSDHGVLHALQVCRAQNRTLAIGMTKVECGIMRERMREARQFGSLPDNRVPAIRARTEDLAPWQR